MEKERRPPFFLYTVYFRDIFAIFSRCTGHAETNSSQSSILLVRYTSAVLYYSVVCERNILCAVPTLVHYKYNSIFRLKTGETGGYDIIIIIICTRILIADICVFSSYLSLLRNIIVYNNRILIVARCATYVGVEAVVSYDGWFSFCLVSLMVMSCVSFVCGIGCFMVLL